MGDAGFPARPGSFAITGCALPRRSEAMGLEATGFVRPAMNDVGAADQPRWLPAADGPNLTKTRLSLATAVSSLNARKHSPTVKPAW